MRNKKTYEQKKWLPNCAVLERNTLSFRFDLSLLCECVCHIHWYTLCFAHHIAPMCIQFQQSLPSLTNKTTY